MKKSYRKIGMGFVLSILFVLSAPTQTFAIDSVAVGGSYGSFIGNSSLTLSPYWGLSAHVDEDNFGKHGTFGGRASLIYNSFQIRNWNDASIDSIKVLAGPTLLGKTPLGKVRTITCVQLGASTNWLTIKGVNRTGLNMSVAGEFRASFGLQIPVTEHLGFGVEVPYNISFGNHFLASTEALGSVRWSL